MIMEQQEFDIQDHCFCHMNKDNDLMCCQCGAILMNCGNCKLGYCEVRSYYEKQSEGKPVYTLNCPVASPNYELLYRRTPV